MASNYVGEYNTVRLHSALGYITPIDQMEGQAMAIFAERRRKLSEARTARWQARKPSPRPSRLFIGNGRLSYADWAKFRFTLNQNNFPEQIEYVFIGRGHRYRFLMFNAFSICPAPINKPPPVWPRAVKAATYEATRLRSDSTERQA
ncbi:MAG: hypothetical protein ACOYMW_09090 [Candidatus Competibacteraceae bacterium]